MIVFMGVSGCGKSTVAAAVASRLGWRFIEGDEFHPPASQHKMRAGVALSDADRAGWLAALAEQLALHHAAGYPVTMSCSALKRAYRDRLRSAVPGLRFVFLQLGPTAALARVAARAGNHLFPPSLVPSQFAALEPPVGEAGVLWLDATAELGVNTQKVVDWLGSSGDSSASTAGAAGLGASD